MQTINTTKLENNTLNFSAKSDNRTAPSSLILNSILSKILEYKTLFVTFKANWKNGQSKDGRGEYFYNLSFKPEAVSECEFSSI